MPLKKILLIILLAVGARSADAYIIQTATSAYIQGECSERAHQSQNSQINSHAVQLINVNTCYPDSAGNSVRSLSAVNPTTGSMRLYSSVKTIGDLYASSSSEGFISGELRFSSLEEDTIFTLSINTKGSLINQASGDVELELNRKTWGIDFSNPFNSFTWIAGMQEEILISTVDTFEFLLPSGDTRFTFGTALTMNARQRGAGEMIGDLDGWINISTSSRIDFWGEPDYFLDYTKDNLIIEVTSPLHPIWIFGLGLTLLIILSNKENCKKKFKSYSLNALRTEL